jgi:hypothetical protein
MESHRLSHVGEFLPTGKTMHSRSCYYEQRCTRSVCRMLTADPGEQHNAEMHQVQSNEVLQQCMQDLALG